MTQTDGALRRLTRHGKSLAQKAIKVFTCVETLLEGRSHRAKLVIGFHLHLRFKAVDDINLLLIFLHLPALAEGEQFREKSSHEHPAVSISDLRIIVQSIILPQAVRHA